MSEVASKPIVGPPSLSPLNVNSENMLKEWEYWSRSFERYCRLAKLTVEEEMIDVFYAYVGRETEEYLRDLPNFAELKTIASLMTVVQARYTKIPNVLCERFNFRKVKISSDESMREFNARLNAYSKNCDFDNYTRDLAHLDQIIMNAHPKLREKLLMEKDLTLNKALDIAQYALEGSRWCNQFEEMNIKEVHFNKDKYSKNFNPKVSNFKPNNSFNKSKKCYRCGSHKHVASFLKCPAIKITCNNCSKLGHFAKFCLSNDKSKPGVRQVSYNGLDTSLNVLPVNLNVCSVSHRFINVNLNGVSTKFIVDSGSQATLIPYEYFSKLNSKLTRATNTLNDYNGNTIECLGQTFVKVTKGKDNFGARIFVTKDKQPLLGTDLISMFKHVDWNKLFIGNVENSNPEFSVEDLMREFKSVFDDVPSDKIKDRSAQLVLMRDAIPKFCSPRNVPLALKPLVEAQIDKFVSIGFWTPVTESKWATPLVPVVKPDGSVRLCGDYKVTVNPQLQVAQHPLPTNEDLFSKLGNNSVFSKIDLCNAFQQLELDEPSKDICTVNTSKGLFRVNRLPFGIASSPALWQRTVDRLFSGLEGVLCFVDDILVAGPDLRSHNERLRKVLSILKENNMHIKVNKCKFAVDSVSYLGFKVDAKGIHKTDDKIKAITNVKVPNSVSELRSFLGLVNFYGKFVPDLSTIAKPLYDLLKNDVIFKWKRIHCESFSKLKCELSSNRFLVHYRANLPLRLSCDASSVGLGVVLSHVFPNGSEHPIAYASRSLQKSELNYSQIDKEALSIIYGVKHFHYYLYGRSFTLITDHKPLLSIFGEKSKLPTMVAARLQRYAIVLSAYTYKIEYRPSDKHGNADALSRLPLNCEVSKLNEHENSKSTLMINFVKTPVSSKEISDSTRVDKVLKTVHDCLLKNIGLPNSSEFTAFRNVSNSLNVDGGVILKDCRVVIPRNLQDKVLKVLHEEHMGISKTKSLARSYVWWPNIDRDIECLIKSCIPCQSYGNNPPKVTTHSWEYPRGPWQRLHVDFAGPMRGITYMVVVDAFSKWPEVFIMNKITSASCIRIFKALFARYGFPYRIVSDNGPQFTSLEFAEFLKTSYGILHSKTAPYYPATNGEAEKFVQTLKNYIKISNPNPSELDTAIQSFLLTYRTTPHSITHSTPSELLYGRQIRNTLDLVRPFTHENLNSMINDTNCSNDRYFIVGDNVMIRNHTGGVNWIEGKIVKVLGKLHYLVDTGNKTQKCHVNQIKRLELRAHDKLIGPYDLSEYVDLETDSLSAGGSGGSDRSSIESANNSNNTNLFSSYSDDTNISNKNNSNCIANKVLSKSVSSRNISNIPVFKKSKNIKPAVIKNNTVTGNIVTRSMSRKSNMSGISGRESGRMSDVSRSSTGVSSGHIAKIKKSKFRSLSTSN